VPISGPKNNAPLAIDADQIEYLHSIGNPEFVANMIEGFFEDMEEMIVPLRNSVVQHDVQKFRFCAHGLKSSANNIGARNLVALGSKLERISEGDFASERDSYLRLVENELLAVKNELADELERCRLFQSQNTETRLKS
jgi:HPt (histidine-containing phosphotransfer) domain-containing protein